MPKCDLCSPVNLHIFRTSYPKNISRWLLLYLIPKYYFIFIVLSFQRRRREVSREVQGQIF